jgi:hypothetical protein
MTVSLVVTPTVGIKNKTVDDIATAMPGGTSNKTLSAIGKRALADDQIAPSEIT